MKSFFETISLSSTLSNKIDLDLRIINVLSEIPENLYHIQNKNSSISIKKISTDSSIQNETIQNFFFPKKMSGNTRESKKKFSFYFKRVSPYFSHKNSKKCLRQDCFYGLIFFFLLLHIVRRWWCKHFYIV